MSTFDFADQFEEMKMIILSLEQQKLDEEQYEQSKWPKFEPPLVAASEVTAQDDLADVPAIGVFYV